jgi:hypothetical protein
MQPIDRGTLINGAMTVQAMPAMPTRFSSSDHAVGDHRAPGMGILSLWGVNRMCYLYLKPDIVAIESVPTDYLLEMNSESSKVLQASAYGSFLARDRLKLNGWW